MGLENLMRKACRWLFLRLKDDMDMKKIYRIDNFTDKIALLGTYRNFYVRMSLYHDEIDSIELIWGKEHLTEQELEKNREAIEIGEKPPCRRGDKPYNFIGIVYDGHKVLEDFDASNGLEKIQTRIYNFFAALARFYKVEKEKTMPALTSISVVAEDDEEFKEYTEKTKICRANPVPVHYFLLELGRMKDHADKNREDSQMLELGLYSKDDAAKPDKENQKS